MPAVLKLFDLFKKCIDFFECSPEKVSDELLSSIKILFKIFEGIISVFRNVDISLSYQLLKRSTFVQNKWHQMYSWPTISQPSKNDPGKLFCMCFTTSKWRWSLIFVSVRYRSAGEAFRSRTVTQSRNCDAMELSSIATCSYNQ